MMRIIRLAHRFPRCRVFAPGLILVLLSLGAHALDSTPALIMTGGNAGDRYGYCVSTAGDLNGDGYSDVVVGAYGYSGSRGRMYVYHGSALGLAAIPCATLTGENTGDYYGFSMATAGDVNGDGYSDVLVGAYGYSGSQGCVYVYRGSAVGIAALPSATLTGQNAGDQFGYSVSSAGDVNDDDYSDVIVGAWGYSGSRGRVYVYHGSALGLETIPSATLTGETNGDAFGFCVAGAKVLNGDDYSDVLIGAPGYGIWGRAYAYPGSAAGVSGIPFWLVTGEEDSQYFAQTLAAVGNWYWSGSSDVIIGDSGYRIGWSRGRAYFYQGDRFGLYTSPDCSASGEDSGDHFAASISGASDTNGDGFCDVIVGAYGYPFASDRGRAYLYGGPPDAYELSPDWTVTGENVGDAFGASVAGAGDVNGDGYADVIVGAYGYPAGQNHGRVYVYHGAGLPTPTEAPTNTPTVTSTPTQTPTPEDTSTPAPTDTSTPTPPVTPTRTPTSVPTALPTYPPTSTATKTPTATHTPTNTLTATSTPTSTGTSTPTASPEPTATSTLTPQPTATSTPTPTATLEPTPTSSGTPTATATPDCVPLYDLSGDGEVDGEDLLLLLEYRRLNDRQGDFDCDGDTDMTDLFLFSRQWDGTAP